MKRGAITQQQLAVTVIIIIGFGIIATFIAKPFIPYFKEEADDETCRTSVLLRSNVIAKLLPAKLPLRCQTSKEQISTTDEAEIKKKFADELASCWNMLGEGKVDFFSVTYGDWGPEPATRCVICTVLEFDENVRQRVNEVKGFGEYLEKTKLKEKGVTYIEYLTNTNGAKFGVETDVDASISTEQKSYAVMLTAAKDVNSFGDFLNVIVPRAGVGALGGIGIGVIFFGVGAVPAAGVGVVAGTLESIGVIIKARIQRGLIGCEGDAGCMALLLIPYDKDAILGAGCKTLNSIP